MSMQSAASPAHVITPPKARSLRHIPGEEGWPFIGRTLNILADPKGEVERMSAKYGPVYRSHVLGETSITALGPEANELVLFDQQKLFSSTYGWEIVLGRLFPRGLMLLDFDEHRLHRRALSVAFKSGPMKSYLAELKEGSPRRVAEWKAQPGPMLFYPAMKQLTLDLAATSFLGTGIGPEVNEITQAFIDMVAAAVAPIRTPAAGHADGARREGAQAHRRLFLRADSDPPRTRRRGGSVLATMPATLEDGALLSTPDIIDHMSFLMLAAHDTLTSSLTISSASLRQIRSGSSGCARKSRTSASARAIRPASTCWKRCRCRKWRSRKRTQEAARALYPAPRDARLHLQGVRDPGRHHVRRQSAVHASHAGDLA